MRVALVFALVLLLYGARLDTPGWQGGARYVFDESYTAFTAHRLEIGDPSVLVPAARRSDVARVASRDLASNARGEWSHPPGAPLAIAATTQLFGFGEVAARLAALLAALITLLATAQLARRAWLACLLLACDGVFFVFARTAMPHMFLTAGITAGAALLSGAASAGTARERWLCALAAGGALGFAVAVRWTAIPMAGAIVVAALVSRERLRGPLIGCVAAALATYVIAYLPWLLHGHGVGELVDLHRAMLAFHTHMPAQLGQSQPFYAWPWCLRPVRFLVEADHGVVRTVMCAGNPLLWWAIVPALVVAAWRARGRALAALLPALVIAATWLPWAMLARFGLSYYLLPALPFTAIVLADVLPRRAALPYAASALLVLALLYPVLAAVPIARATYERYRAVLDRSSPPNTVSTSASI